MNAIRNSYGKFSRCLCFLFALHLFNLSIDSNDREFVYDSEYLSLNDAASVAKFFVNVFLSIDDSWERQEQSDWTDMDFSSELCKDFCCSESVQIAFRLEETIKIKYYITNARNVSMRAQEIVVPPPRA